MHKATIHPVEKNEQTGRGSSEQGRSISRVGAVIYLPLCVMLRREEGEEKPSDMATGSHHNGALSIFSELLVALSGRFPPLFKSGIRSNP